MREYSPASNLQFYVTANLMYFLSITNKLQRYTIFFITVNALHVPGGFSVHYQELKTVNTASSICQACLLLPLAWARELTHASGSSKHA